MKILSWEDFQRGSLDSFNGGAATIGVFDGMHRGHSYLLSLVREAAPEGKRVVFTFRENPKRILKPAQYRGCLFSLRQKMEMLEAEGIDLCVLIDFSGNFSKMTGNEFLSALVQSLPLGSMFIGNDFHCGYGLSTDAEGLKVILSGFGVETGIVDPLRYAGKVISSSGIRHAVEDGRFADATEMLGRAYVLDLREAALECADGKTRILRSAQVLPRHGSYVATVVQGGSEFSVTVMLASDGIVEISPCHGEMPDLLRF